MVWTAPRTFVAGEVLTAAIFNTHLRDNLKAIGDPWTTYVPAVGGWTLGNGILAAAYSQAGKYTTIRFRLTVGTTTVAAASLAIGLPVTTPGNYVAGERWAARDVSAATTAFGDIDILGGTSTINLRATNPFVWASTDYIGAEFTVEAA